MVGIQKPISRDDPIILKWGRQTRLMSNPRASAFFRLWMEGDGFRGIGLDASLSGQRVGQIIHKIARQALWLERRDQAMAGAPTPETILAYMEFSTRSANAMKNEGILTLAMLATKTEAEVLRIPNFGRKSLKEMRAMLASVGMKFAEDVKRPAPRPPQSARRVPTDAETERFREARAIIEEARNVESVSIQSALLQWRTADQSGDEDEMGLARKARDALLKQWGF